MDRDLTGGGREKDVAAAPSGVLQRGLLVLDCLAGGRNLSHSELTALTGLDKSTVHRLLQVLIEADYVWRDPGSRRYQLHVGILRLARAALEQVRLPLRSQVMLEWLRNETGESAAIHIRSGNYRICTEEVESRSSLRMGSGVGSMRPLCSGAPGKALVAFLPPTDQERVLATPEALGHWVDKVDALRAEIKLIQQQGYAVSSGETTTNARAVAAPIWDFRGRAFASVNVAAPSVRLTPERVEAVATTLLKATDELSRDMGARREPQ